MHLYEKTMNRMKHLDQEKMEEARRRVDALIKPPKSLGRLEELAVQLAGITKEIYPDVSKKAVIVMAGDHGVYEEGISSNPQTVTTMQTTFFPKGLTGVCSIAEVSGAEVVVVDVGVKDEIPEDTGVINRKIKYGTNNMMKEAAMTKEEVVQAIEVGIGIAEEQIHHGVKLLGVGEMGIGNTTPATAIVSVLGAIDPAEITGRGAGTGAGGISHKAEVIRRAIEVNHPNREDALGILSKVGGLEIAGMTGVILAAAANRIPVVIDGYIATAAALIAYSLEPKAKGYMIPSHLSMEPGAKQASELLGIKPFIHMDMCLGEGSGGALMFPIIDAACSMVKNMATFEEVGMKI